MRRCSGLRLPSQSAVEAAFYEAVAPYPAVSRLMPRLVGHDPHSGILALEDLGAARDLLGLYLGSRLPDGALPSLLSWLGALHAVSVDASLRGILQNRSMRLLNHAHIFQIPLQPDNGLDLDAILRGLRGAAAELKVDPALEDAARRLGAVYMAEGPALLHGDFYPGSILLAGDGLRVIDPEFGFLGPPEFDLGVFEAHLCMAGASTDAYEVELARSYPGSYDLGLLRAFAGIEIIRRVLGVAQLPLAAGLAERAAWLAQGRRWLLDWAA